MIWVRKIGGLKGHVQPDQEVWCELRVGSLEELKGRDKGLSEKQTTRARIQRPPSRGDNEAMRAHKILACNVTANTAQLAGVVHRAAEVTGSPRRPLSIKAFPLARHARPWS